MFLANGRPISLQPLYKINMSSVACHPGVTNHALAKTVYVMISAMNLYHKPKKKLFVLLQ